ncbi:hypothetical protein A9P82_02525 [Arachidicoccus ginsenosidimutans]|nr:hypothetical protein A9P82_02525 [Arachidicoccus sp. BS20]
MNTLPAVQNVLHQIKQRFGNYRLVLPFDKPAFFIFIFGNKNLSAVKRVADSKPEIIFCARQSLLFCHFINGFGMKNPFRDFFKRPF